MLVAGCQGRALEQARANASYDFVTLSRAALKSGIPQADMRAYNR
jgi:hypothetical protein